LARLIAAALAALACSAPLLAQATPAAPAIPRSVFIRDMDGEFAKMDADKNGQITAAESAAFQRGAALAAAEARNVALFRQLDSDKNGQISPVEFRKVIAAAPQADGQRFIAVMDLNKDRQVNLVEHRTVTLANFDRLDSDKDGVVTPAEMKAGGIIR
jgi:Ca2+-binding EF-hand superfamily protein